MSAALTEYELARVRELRAHGGELWERVAAKCQWEHMIPAAVLREGWFADEADAFMQSRGFTVPTRGVRVMSTEALTAEAEQECSRILARWLRPPTRSDR